MFGTQAPHFYGASYQLSWGKKCILTAQISQEKKKYILSWAKHAIGCMSLKTKWQKRLLAGWGERRKAFTLQRSHSLTPWKAKLLILISVHKSSENGSHPSTRILQEIFVVMTHLKQCAKNMPKKIRNTIQCIQKHCDW